MQKHPSGGAPLTNLEPAILFSEDRKVIAASPYQMDWQHHPSGGIHTFKGSDTFQVTLRSAANSKSGASAVEVKWHGVTVRWHVVDK
jgi:hypothetical protein